MKWGEISESVGDEVFCKGNTICSNADAYFTNKELRNNWYESA